ncbi:hypothetical protein [Sphingobium sp.]|uniref:hypothetical protein n=1 Tax=Sphingobium sp. TaxID=1912891 RepID=UPI003BB5F4D4
MSDNEKWAAVVEQLKSIREFAEESRYTINAYRLLLEDLLAHIAVMKPDPAKFIDDMVLSMHASHDGAAAIMNERPEPTDRRGQLSAEIGRKGMIATRTEYERIAASATRRLTQQGKGKS